MKKKIIFLVAMLSSILFTTTAFAITADDNDSSKIAVSVDRTVDEGKYEILAENTGVGKGVEIEVVDSLFFLEPLDDIVSTELPKNMLSEPHSAHYMNRHGALAKIIPHDGYGGDHLADNIIEYTCDASAVLYAPAINGSRIDNRQIRNDSLFNWTQFEKDASYLVEIKVQNADTTYEPYFGFVASAGDGTTTVREYKLEKITATGDEWQTISTVFTPSVAGSSSSYVMIGYPTGQSAINGETIAPVTGWKVILDKSATTITKLSPAEVKVTEVAGAEDLTFKAEVVNQLGTTQGVAGQNFTWFATNIERTKRIEGITLMPSVDTSTVTVETDDTVADGTYAIVAIAEDYGLIKGINVEITKSTNVNIIGATSTTDSLKFISKVEIVGEPSISAFGTTFIPLWLFEQNSTNTQQVSYDNSQYNIQNGQTFGATLTDIPEACKDMMIVAKSYIKDANGKYTWSKAKSASVNNTILTELE